MIAMAACREELLGQLQRLGCVEIREPETAGEDWSGLLERESSRLAEAKGALAEVNTALAAMRHIAYGDAKRLLSFSLGEESLRLLGDLTEAYLHTQLERGFRTLDFYKQLNTTV